MDEHVASLAPAATRWLSEAEQSAWSGLLRMHAQLLGLLGRELAEHSDLSLADYAVLVELAARDDGRLRPFELGRVLGWEKSRLSHHVGRMVARGLVSRERCPSDQRGLLVALTPGGRAALERAAPDHVAEVRRSFVDLLTAEQLATVAEVARTVMDALAGSCGGDGEVCGGDGDALAGSCGGDGEAERSAAAEGGPRGR